MKKILFFLFLVVLLIAALSFVLSLTHKVPMGEKKVALVRVEGIILDSRKVIEEIDEYSEDPSVSAVVLRIDSPGGAVAPAQEIFEEILKLKERKKVVVSMGSIAASGGYYISSPADRIVANSGTITGSIGVIMEIHNVKGLLDKIGVKSQTIKSGQFKDIASVFKSMSEEEQRILQTLLDDVHSQFIQAVSEGRGLAYDEVKRIADGRIFTGKKARELGLVDELGNLNSAIRLAGELSGIEGKPRIVSRKDRFSVWELLFGSDMPTELIKEGFSGIRLKYLLTP